MKEIKVPEVPRSRMVAAERDALMSLALCDHLIIEISEVLSKRAKMLKNGRQCLGMMKYCVEYIFMGMMNSMTNEQLEAFKRNVEGMSYRIGSKGPVKNGHADEFGLWASFKDLEALSDAASDRCLTCDLCDGRERSCPLRKALDNLGCDLKHEDNGTGCAYRWL